MDIINCSPELVNDSCINNLIIWCIEYKMFKAYAMRLLEWIIIMFWHLIVKPKPITVYSQFEKKKQQNQFMKFYFQSDLRFSIIESVCYLLQSDFVQWLLFCVFQQQRKSHIFFSSFYKTVIWLIKGDIYKRIKSISNINYFHNYSVNQIVAFECEFSVIIELARCMCNDDRFDVALAPLFQRTINFMWP